MFRLWITLMRWSWRRSCCVVSMLMVLNDHLLFSSEPSCPALWAMMLLLKLNLVQERQLHSPSRFFSRLTLNWMSARLWCWPQLANWRSRSRRYLRYFSSSFGCIFCKFILPNSRSSWLLATTWMPNVTLALVVQTSARISASSLRVFTLLLERRVASSTWSIGGRWVRYYFSH